MEPLGQYLIWERNRSRFFLVGQQIHRENNFNESGRGDGCWRNKAEIGLWCRAEAPGTCLLIWGGFYLSLVLNLNNSRRLHQKWFRQTLIELTFSFGSISRFQWNKFDLWLFPWIQIIQKMRADLHNWMESWTFDSICFWVYWQIETQGSVRAELGAR